MHFIFLKCLVVHVHFLRIGTNKNEILQHQHGPSMTTMNHFLLLIYEKGKQGASLITIFAMVPSSILPTCHNIDNGDILVYFISLLYYTSWKIFKKNHIEYLIFYVLKAMTYPIHNKDPRVLFFWFLLLYYMLSYLEMH